MNRLALLLAAVTLTAGCGGPDRPLQVGFKEVPSNVLLGGQSTPSPVPPVVGPPVVGVPVVLLPPPSVVALPPAPLDVPPVTAPRPLPSPPPAAPTCPPADPLQGPAVEAPPTITARPAAAQYLFRNDGTFTVSGADPQQGRFPATTLRTVTGALEAGDGSGFVFGVSELVGDTTTKTDYTVVTSRPLASPFEPGLYLSRVTTTDAGGTSTVFEPVPSLLLAAFPFTRGERVESRGVDPETGTVMSFTSTVTGKARVDACGELLDSWTLELTEGRVLSPDTDVDFTATYAVGTQYGGLVLRDSVVYAGEVRGAGLSRTNTGTIAQVPRAAAEAQP